MITWNGGECPVPGDTPVRIVFGELAGIQDARLAARVAEWPVSSEYVGGQPNITEFEVIAPSEWIDWSGGECPVHPDVWVGLRGLGIKVVLNGGSVKQAKDFIWENNEFEYRVVPEPGSLHGTSIGSHVIHQFEPPAPKRPVEWDGDEPLEVGMMVEQGEVMLVSFGQCCVRIDGREIRIYGLASVTPIPDKYKDAASQLCGGFISSSHTESILAKQLKTLEEMNRIKVIEQ